jgi:hypothetical protein
LRLDDRAAAEGGFSEERPDIEVDFSKNNWKWKAELLWT